MQLFFSQHRDGDLIVLGESESRHCVQVLRKKPGDEITVADGKGRWFLTHLIDANRKKCVVKISEETRRAALPAHLHLAIAPTKNISRLEWFLEKATEMGIREISLIYCRRSERRKVNTERLRRILVGAMKQSLNAFLPVLHEPASYEEFLQRSAIASAEGFIAHCLPGEKHHLRDLLSAGNDTVVLIGPEGDFAEEEVERAVDLGYRPVSLGTARLRTETAAVAVSVFFNWLNDFQ